MLGFTLALMLSVQDDPTKGPDFAQRQAARDWHTEDIQALQLGIRVTGLGGQIDGEEDWGDFFGSGVGIDLGYEILWKATPVVHAGVYGRVSFDKLSGDKADLSDATGTFIFDNDDLTLFKLVFGGRIRESFKAFFMDQSIGFGFVSYSDVDSTITDDLGSFDAEIISGSTEFAFELAARFGFYLTKAPNAPTISMTFAFEHNGAPDAGSDFSDVDTEEQKNFVWTVGGSFSF